MRLRRANFRGEKTLENFDVSTLSVGRKPNGKGRRILAKLSARSVLATRKRCRPDPSRMI